MATTITIDAIKQIIATAKNEPVGTISDTTAIRTFIQHLSDPDSSIKAGHKADGWLFVMNFINGLDRERPDLKYLLIGINRLMETMPAATRQPIMRDIITTGQNNFQVLNDCVASLQFCAENDRAPLLDSIIEFFPNDVLSIDPSLFEQAIKAVKTCAPRDQSTLMKTICEKDGITVYSLYRVVHETQHCAPENQVDIIQTVLKIKKSREHNIMRAIDCLHLFAAENRFAILKDVVNAAKDDTNILSHLMSKIEYLPADKQVAAVNLISKAAKGDIFHGWLIPQINKCAANNHSSLIKIVLDNADDRLSIFAAITNEAKNCDTKGQPSLFETALKATSNDAAKKLLKEHIKWLQNKPPEPNFNPLFTPPAP